MKSLIDTHILLWWLGPDFRLSKEQKRILTRATADNPIHVSDISLWEVATLFELGRIRLAYPLRDWLQQATAEPLVRRVGISPRIAAEVAALPQSLHRDPADRILVATARVLSAQFLTRDQRIIDSGLVRAV